VVKWSELIGLRWPRICASRSSLSRSVGLSKWPERQAVRPRARILMVEQPYLLTTQDLHPLAQLQRHPPQLQSTPRDPHPNHTHHVGLRADQGRQELCSRTVSYPRLIAPTTNIPPCTTLAWPSGNRLCVLFLLLNAVFPITMLSLTLPLNPYHEQTHTHSTYTYHGYAPHTDVC
jgi:hypothetical protein